MLGLGGRGQGISEEFRVNVGLGYGSALSILLFIEVVEVISRIQDTDTDDLTVEADSEADLQELFVEWK